jgi:hypothetical protein
MARTSLQNGHETIWVAMASWTFAREEWRLDRKATERVSPFGGERGSRCSFPRDFPRMPESQGGLAGRHSLSAQGLVSLDVPRPRRAGREQHTPPVLLPSHFYSRRSTSRRRTAIASRLSKLGNPAAPPPSTSWRRRAASPTSGSATPGASRHHERDIGLRDYMTVSGVLAWRAGRATSKRAAVAAD